MRTAFLLVLAGPAACVLGCAPQETDTPTPISCAEPLELGDPDGHADPFGARAAGQARAGRLHNVAGVAQPDTRVRVYANEILLGDAESSPNGRFLIETECDLPVGDYIIRADMLDAQFNREGLSGPLHGIPVIIKDNYDTHDMPTSAGSLSLIDSVPPDDAWQVRKLREAGAIILAKSNMYEFAFSPYETVGSALPGHTRNPYALNRVPAGSSGGTGAAIAAGFAVLGLGTDTGNSIRGPASHNALVGIRSTLGLTSRDGIVPLYLDHDVGGPMTRSVADAAVVLTVIAGYDPGDPITSAAQGRTHDDYSAYLDADGLRGARIGVMRQLSNREGADTEVLVHFEEAVDDMRNAGAIIVDPLTLVELDMLVPPVSGESLPVWCSRFQADLNDYLATLGDSAPYHTLQEIYDSGKFHPQLTADIEYFLEQAQRISDDLMGDPR